MDLKETKRTSPSKLNYQLWRNNGIITTEMKFEETMGFEEGWGQEKWNILSCFTLNIVKISIWLIKIDCFDFHHFKINLGHTRSVALIDQDQD